MNLKQWKNLFSSFYCSFLVVKIKNKKKNTKTDLEVLNASSSVQIIDSIKVDSVYFPEANDLKNVLLVSTYHNEEVWNGAEKQEWFGLFKNDSGCYLARTKIKKELTEDPIADENGAKTGWEISTENKDSCIILLSKIVLREGKIQSPIIDISKLDCFRETDEDYNKQNHPFTIQPKEFVSFTFNNSQYSIIVTGIKPKDKDSNGINYKLSLKNKAQEQKIIVSPNFGDRFPQILWLGDIDGDGKLDLIIDVSNQDNVIRTAVFLSSKATKNELVKYFGECLEVGC